MLQRTTTHCNTLRHTRPPDLAEAVLQHTVTYSQHIATYCNTLQHTATHCNTLGRQTQLRLCYNTLPNWPLLQSTAPLCSCPIGVCVCTYSHTKKYLSMYVYTFIDIYVWPLCHRQRPYPAYIYPAYIYRQRPYPPASNLYIFSRTKTCEHICTYVCVCMRVCVCVCVCMNNHTIIYIHNTYMIIHIYYHSRIIRISTVMIIQ